jgi:hypothetical protein
VLNLPYHLRRDYADRCAGGEQLLELARGHGTAADEHDAAAGKIEKQGQ